LKGGNPSPRFNPEDMRKRILTIDTRRWHDSSGNTYHSRRVCIDGESAPEANTNFEYGYGTHSEYEAIEKLIKSGALRYAGRSHASHHVAEANDCKLNAVYTDVRRRKDLHGGGREA
jgi:hypothetical protein